MAVSIVHKVRYITDETGKRHEVIIPFKIWKSITKELEKLREKQQILLGIDKMDIAGGLNGEVGKILEKYS